MGVYTKGKWLLGSALVTTGSTFKLMLVTTQYTFSSDHNTVDDGTTSDPLSYEISVAGYARQSLGSITLTEDDTNSMACFDAADTTFGNLTAGQTIGGCCIYPYSSSGTTSDTGQYLLSNYTFATAVPCNGAAFTVQYAATSDGGFLKLGTTS